MVTYPNQKVIHINKPKYKEDFTYIGVEEWKRAFKELKPSTFGIYLYLASNADGFDLALSQKAIEEALGIKKTGYHDAISELQTKGYIVFNQSNVFNFYTAPVRKNELQEKSEQSVKKNCTVRKNEPLSSQKRTEQSAKTNLSVRGSGREIKNINIINKTNKTNTIRPSAAKGEKEMEKETKSNVIPFVPDIMDGVDIDELNNAKTHEELVIAAGFRPRDYFTNPEKYAQ